MSITLNPRDADLGREAATVSALAAKLKARLAAREGVAPKTELDELRHLISALDPMGREALPADTLRQVAQALDPFTAAERAAATMSDQTEMSALRRTLYAKALYTPAPTFYAAKALGAVLKAVGL